MANHVVECPVCHSSLLIAHETSQGGTVMDHLVLLDSLTETPAVAKARVAWEEAVAAEEAPQAAVYEAQGKLDADAAAVPVDDAKVAEDSAALQKAQTELAVAAKATADAKAAYDAARALPRPLEVGALSADGNWKWDGKQWVELASIPPPLPPEAQEAAEPVTPAAPAETPAEEATADV